MTFLCQESSTELFSSTPWSITKESFFCISIGVLHQHGIQTTLFESVAERHLTIWLRNIFSSKPDIIFLHGQLHLGHLLQPATQS